MPHRTILPLLSCMATGFAIAAPQPPTYVCQRTEERLVIDGKADEAAWQKACALSPLRDIEGAAIPNRTVIKMLWDNNYLYVHAAMQEPHLWATLTERDSVIYQDPDFEVFIDPDGDTKNYVEIEINALNTVWDLLLTEPYRSGNLALHDWNIPGLQHAVHLRGTLNSPTDTDDGWSVELAIPWASITGHSNHPRTAPPPAPGTTLRMNFSRVNWQVQADATAPCGYRKKTNSHGTPLPESNHVWAATGEINIHMPEHWGYVRLSNTPAGTWENMPVPATHATEQLLFAYYNKQLAYQKKHGEFDTAMQPQPPVSTPILTPQYFAAEATVPRTGQRIRLDSHATLTRTEPTRNIPEIYLWVHGNNHPGDTAFRSKEFAAYAAAGVNVLIIGGTAEQIAALTPLATQHGMQVYAWLWAANRPGDAIALQHPHWYAVNRIGKSCHAPQDRPFVEYYQFLCPNCEEARTHLLAEIDKLAAIPGIIGIQLDYMRMPDVILPRGLWGNYGLDMSRELPEYDYCYCHRCQELFRRHYGRDISPAADTDTDWREFRLQSVANYANTLLAHIRSHNLRTACAVFPTPHLAAKLVRQDWSRFQLDLALPMVYYSFYNEPPQWSADCTAQATTQTQGRIALAPGLHLPDTAPGQFPAELSRLHAASPAGIGIFCDDLFTPPLQQALRHWLNEQMQPPPHTSGK
ncbi:MAG: hypothetical protein E7033_01540 [Akkermansiaceae bacterium]|nr:hypothetical protein [Akkermansiaceae bacterium]